MATVEIVITADPSQLSRGMRQATRELQKFDKSAQGAAQRLQDVGQRMKGIGTSLSIGVTAPLTAAGAAVAKLGSDFETSMTRIETLVGASREQVDAWSDELRRLGPELGKGPRELADALFVVTSAGQEGSEALEIVAEAARASAIGLGTTETVARAVTAAMTAYADEGLTAARATEILTATVREGNLQAEQLAPALGRVIGIAAQVGVSFEEVGASVAAFTRLGVSAEEAITGLRGILNALLKPSAQAEEALASIGLTTEELRQQVQDVGLAQTLFDLIRAFEGNEEALSAVIPNVRALAAVLGTAGAQGDEYIQILQNIEDSHGIVEEGFDRVGETARQQWNEAAAAFTTAAITLSSELLPAITDIAESITPMAQNLSEFVEEHPNVTKVAVAFAGIAAAVGPALFVLGQIATVIGGIAPVASTAIGALGSVGASLAALAGGPVTVALAAVAGLAVAWNTNFLGIRDTTLRIIAELNPALEELSARLAEIITGSREAIGPTEDLAAAQGGYAQSTDTAMQAGDAWNRMAGVQAAQAAVARAEIARYGQELEEVSRKGREAASEQREFSFSAEDVQQAIEEASFGLIQFGDAAEDGVGGVEALAGAVGRLKSQADSVLGSLMSTGEAISDALQARGRADPAFAAAQATRQLAEAQRDLTQAVASGDPERIANAWNALFTAQERVAQTTNRVTSEFNVASDSGVQAASRIEQAWDSALGRIESAAASALQADTNVTREDFILEKFGLRRESVFESVRQLNDVIQRALNPEEFDFEPSPFINQFTELQGLAGEELAANAIVLRDRILNFLEPDFLNIDSALAKARETLIGEANKQDIIQEMTQQLVSEGFAEEEVQRILGERFGGAGEQIATQIGGAIEQSAPAIQQAVSGAFSGAISSASGQAGTLADTLNQKLSSALATLRTEQLEPTISMFDTWITRVDTLLTRLDTLNQRMGDLALAPAIAGTSARDTARTIQRKQRALNR